MSAGYMYDDLSLQYCRTVQYSAETEYDPTGTDAIYIKYTIRVRGFISDTSSFPGLNTAQTLAAIQARLQSPRRRMSYSIGDQTVVQVTKVPDAKLGPKPLPTVATAPNSGLFYVETGCEVWLVKCDEECDGRDPVVSLRWTQTESFDRNWYSTLSTKGLLIVRADLRKCADNFRPLATPPVLPDYQRVASSYTLSPDGLQLQFEFTDQEMDRLPPAPALTASGTYAVEIKRPGVIRIGTVSVTVEGSKGTSRRALLVLAVRMCMSKLDADRTQTSAQNPTVIWWGRLEEDLFVPKVTVSISANMQPVQTKTTKSEAFVSLMPSVGLNTVGLKSNSPGIMAPERKRLAGLLAAAFRDPCACADSGGEAELRSSGSPPFPAPNTSITNPNPTGSAELRTSITIGAISAAAGAIANGVIDPAQYDEYQIETTQIIDNGLAHLPGTGVGPEGNIARVVSYAGQKMSLLVTWVAARTGTPPQLPTFLNRDPNLVPLRGSVVAKDITSSPEGTQLVYSYAGYYELAVLDPAKFNFASPVAPQFGPPVRQASLRGMSAWTNSPVWGQLTTAPTGTAPLVPGGVAPGTTPTPPSAFTGLIGTLSDAYLGIAQGVVGGNGGTWNFYFPPTNP